MTNEKKIKLMPVKDIPGAYPGCFSTSSIRWLIFNEKSNGFSVCVRRIGRKILIDIDAFEKWIDSQGPKND